VPSVAILAALCAALFGGLSGERGGDPARAASGTPDATSAVVTGSSPAPATPAPISSTDAQRNARNAVAIVEACFTDRNDYRPCTRGKAGSLGTNTGLTFVSRPPKAGEVRVIAKRSDSYRVIAADTEGTRWIITKRPRTGLITRTCRYASGEGCPPASW
jgi:hypothetical protein